MSGVSTSVHMDLTPKLSAANGVTLILFRMHLNLLYVSIDFSINIIIP